MSRRSTRLLQGVLSALHYSGVDGLIAPYTSGAGVIFMLHHVTPAARRDFEPNGILRITPAFLEGVIRQVRDAGFDCISMDEVSARLKNGEAKAPFAAFTLDDGYKDNRDYAYPIFKRQGVPFTVYVPSDFGDGTGDLWWLTLEEAVRRLDDVSLEMNGALHRFPLATAGEKDVAFREIYWWLRGLDEASARAITHDLADRAGFDYRQICKDLVMSWDELRNFSSDPLVTIGAHTNAHHALAKLSRAEARREIVESILRVEKELGKPCRHFSYPYGCEASAGAREFDIVSELGIATAVTTRKGLLHTRDAQRMAALPRLSLNGDFQDPRYVKVLLSGVPFAIWNGMRRLSRPSAGAAKAA